MGCNGVVKIDANNKELTSFLERLRLAGELRVELNGELFRISFAKATSEKGRKFLTEGGMLDDG